MKNPTVVFASILIYVILVADAGALWILNHRTPRLRGDDWIALSILIFVMNCSFFWAAMRKFLSKKPR